MDLTDQINVDRSPPGSRPLSAMRPPPIAPDEKIQGWFEANAPELKSPVTGQTHAHTMISARDVPSMLQGTHRRSSSSPLSSSSCSNPKLGIVSLVLNLLPAVMGFGLWGYMVGNVTLAVSIVVAMTLGIVVDDTVHFMLKYANARKRGESAENSVRYASSRSAWH